MGELSRSEELLLSMHVPLELAEEEAIMGWSSWTEGVLIIWSAAATRCSVPKSSQQAICRRNGMAQETDMFC